VDDRLEDVPVRPERLRAAAVQAFAQPVRYGLAYGVVAGGPLDPGMDVAVKLGELVFDLVPRTAGYLAPEALAVWP
jgi:hypothetical protein